MAPRRAPPPAVEPPGLAPEPSPGHQVLAGIRATHPPIPGAIGAGPPRPAGLLPEVEPDLARFELQPGVECLAGLRFEPLDDRGLSVLQERPGDLDPDPLARDRLPDCELASLLPA